MFYNRNTNNACPLNWKDEREKVSTDSIIIWMWIYLRPFHSLFSGETSIVIGYRITNLMSIPPFWIHEWRKSIFQSFNSFISNCLMLLYSRREKFCSFETSNHVQLTIQQLFPLLVSCFVTIQWPYYSLHFHFNLL